MKKNNKATMTRIDAAKINAEICKCGCECHKGVSITHMVECCRHIDMQPIDLRSIDEPYIRPDPSTY